MGLGEFGGDGERGVVPEDFGAGAEAGRGFQGALDVDEVGGPRGGGPGGVVEAAVDGEGRGGAGVAGDGGERDERRHAFAPGGETRGGGGGGGRGESEGESESESERESEGKDEQAEDGCAKTNGGISNDGFQG